MKSDLYCSICYDKIGFVDYRIFDIVNGVKLVCRKHLIRENKK